MVKTNKMKAKFVTKHNIIISDNEIQKGDFIYNNISKSVEEVVKVSDLHYIKNVVTKTKTSGGCLPYSNCKLIIAGLPGLPLVNYNGFEQRFGIVDVDKLAKLQFPTDEYITESDVRIQRNLFIQGFEACQELYCKMYSEEDVNYALDQLIRASKGERSNQSTMRDFLNEAKQPQVIDIEISDILFFTNAESSDITLNSEGVTDTVLRHYKIINNSIKIIDVL